MTSLARLVLSLPLGFVPFVHFLTQCPNAFADPPAGTVHTQTDNERRYRERCEPYEGDPRAWPSQTPFDADGLEMMTAFSHCSWAVSLRPDGVVAATVHFPARGVVTLPFTPSVVPKWQIARCAGDTSDRADPPLAISDFLAVPGGYLVGYNSGEFGGGVYHFDSKGGLIKRIATENAFRIFPESQGALVFTGLAHMFYDSGHVIRLAYRAKHWHVNRAHLPGAPDVVLPERDGSYLLVTASDLFRVTPQLRVVLLHRGSWGGNVAPNSIVQDSSGTFYLGMRYAVARLRPTGGGYLEEWLAPLGPQSPPRKDAG